MEDIEKSNALEERPGELDLLDSYDNDKPGYVALLVFTKYKQSPRKNALENVRPLVDILPKFGFQIKTIAIDETTKHTENLFTTFRKADFSAYSSFLLIVSSHGDQTGIIHPRSKSWHFKYSTIQEDVDANTSLKGKPKWNIFSCCNGDKPDLAPPMENMRYTTAAEGLSSVCTGDDSLPKYCDMIITYASVKGYFALRDVNDGGTWLLNALTQSLQDAFNSITQKPELPQEFDVMRLIARMGDTVSKFSYPVEVSGQTHRLKQMSETIVRLRKMYQLRITNKPAVVEDDLLELLRKKLKSLKVREPDQTGFGEPGFSNFKSQDEEQLASLPTNNLTQLTAEDEESITTPTETNARVPEVADSNEAERNEDESDSVDEEEEAEADEEDDDDSDSS